MEVIVRDMITGETFRSNAGRDIAYFLPKLLYALGEALQLNRLPAHELRRLEAGGGVPDDLGRAYGSLHYYFSLCTHPHYRDPNTALMASGFFEVNPVAQSLCLEALARGFLGAAYMGKRTSTMEGECPHVLALLLEQGLSLWRQRYQELPSPQTAAAAAGAPDPLEFLSIRRPDIALAITPEMLRQAAAALEERQGEDGMPFKRVRFNWLLYTVSFINVHTPELIASKALCNGVPEAMEVVSIVD
jgi:hypothetical protein